MRAKGFTLVEILIVVVILGILAAIVIPQFTDASTEAKNSSLVSDLQTLRAQIELYKIQHNDTLPGSVAAVDFESAMTMYTDITGATTSATKDVVNKVIYGPYLQKIPTNQFNNFNTVRLDGANAGANTHGWRLDMTSGLIQADDNWDKDGVAGPDHAGL